MEKKKELIDIGVLGEIKNVDAAYELVFIKGWDIDPEQKINKGQINDPNTDAFYDAETDTFF
jgi:hypothetical protein